MEKTILELDEMRQKMGILHKKLTDEEIVNDDSVRQAMQEFAKAEYGSLAFRIAGFTVLVVLILLASWFERRSIETVILASCILLVIGLIEYRMGAFRSTDRVVREMTYADIEDMRLQEQQQKKPWSHVKSVFSFTIGFLFLLSLFRLPELRSGEQSFWGILWQGILTGMLVETINYYYFRRNEKKLLEQIDEKENG